jgi:hypothetical protein
MHSFSKAMVSAVLLLASAAARPSLAALPAASAAADIAGMWPRTIAKDGASVTIYQPQAVSWPGRQRLTARAAVAIKPKGRDQALLGTIELSLATSTDAAAGMVTLSDPLLLTTHFPSLDTQQAAALEAKLRAALPGFDVRPVPLAAVLLSLNQTPAAPAAVKNDPPQIFYAAAPASLVVFDGPPLLAPAGKSGISYAVNTNWNVFAYQGNWYLLNNGQWFTAGATGPYTPVSRLPEAFRSLPKDANFADARKAVPPRAAPAGYSAPAIFVSMQPAEIILTQGAPVLQAVSGTALQRVANTDSMVFFDPSQKRFYVLMSGRWFAAAALTGPWSYASDSLPADFALIPPASPEAALLPSVPDTPQAQDAVLKAQIPVTATLQRATAKIAVVYAGAPQFVPIAGTPILRAANTSSVVLRIEGRFYACVNGAWFVAGSPAGPWVLADAIPPVIKTIPPASVAYPVTYVDVYAATPAAVTYGYTAGYVMGFVSTGVLVYGTGYYYPPYVIPGPVPIFFPYPYSYVGHVYYSAATGVWARGGTIYGPYGAATGGRYYNPATGAWAHGGAVYGPYGGVGGFSAYNPSTGSYARGSASWNNGYGTGTASFYNANTGRSGSTNQNWSPYGRSGSSTVSGPNQTVHTQSGRNANGAAGSFSSSTGAQGAGYHNSRTGSNGGAVKTANGDVYAGRDGNVYKHTDDGWQKYDKGSWNQVQKPQNYNRQSAGGRSGYGGTDRGNYQQLEQDRVGRQNGWGGGAGGGFRGGGGRRFK